MRGEIKMRLRKNKREREVQLSALKCGFEVLTKGWPDFLLYDKSKNKALFVEVKRKYKTKGATGLSSHQRRLHKILRNLGLNVTVVYIK